MALALALIVASQAAPTLETIQKLPPPLAGALALSGHDHGPIEQVLHLFAGWATRRASTKAP